MKSNSATTTAANSPISSTFRRPRAMKVALAHHWLINWRGGEKVLEAIADFYPEADIYCLVFDKQKLPPSIADRNLIASPLQLVPGGPQFYKYCLPFHPFAIRRLQVPSDIDLVISTDAALMKGIRIPDGAEHYCYCHSPPRYLWEMNHQYKRQLGTLAKFVFDRSAGSLKKFDYEAAQNVTKFIANSQFVADRIRNYYGRESEVINPPVNVDAFRHDRPRADHYLVVSELVTYKRIDIAVEAFNRTGEKLVIIGDGPQRERLQAIAKDNIQFLGKQPDSVLIEKYETAKGFIFPGIEDFGITPLEAQAAGCPVIAFRKGGALETVIEGKTGVFFDEQTADSLANCLKNFDATKISPEDCLDNAMNFRPEVFKEKFRSFVSNATSRRPGSAPA